MMKMMVISGGAGSGPALLSPPACRPRRKFSSSSPVRESERVAAPATEREGVYEHSGFACLHPRRKLIRLRRAETAEHVTMARGLGSAEPWMSSPANN